MMQQVNQAQVSGFDGFYPLNPEQMHY